MNTNILVISQLLLLGIVELCIAINVGLNGEDAGITFNVQNVGKASFPHAN